MPTDTYLNSKSGYDKEEEAFRDRLLEAPSPEAQRLLDFDAGKKARSDEALTSFRRAFELGGTAALGLPALSAEISLSKIGDAVTQNAKDSDQAMVDLAEKGKESDQKLRDISSQLSDRERELANPTRPPRGGTPAAQTYVTDNATDIGGTRQMAQAEVDAARAASAAEKEAAISKSVQIGREYGAEGVRNAKMYQEAVKESAANPKLHQMVEEFAAKYRIPADRVRGMAQRALGIAARTAGASLTEMGAAGLAVGVPWLFLQEYSRGSTPRGQLQHLAYNMLGHPLNAEDLDPKTIEMLRSDQALVAELAKDGVLSVGLQNQVQQPR